MRPTYEAIKLAIIEESNWQWTHIDGDDTSFIPTRADIMDSIAYGFGLEMEHEDGYDTWPFWFEDMYERALDEINSAHYR